MLRIWRSGCCPRLPGCSLWSAAARRLGLVAPRGSLGEQTGERERSFAPDTGTPFCLKKKAVTSTLPAWFVVGLAHNR